MTITDIAAVRRAIDDIADETFLLLVALADALEEAGAVPGDSPDEIALWDGGIGYTLYRLVEPVGIDGVWVHATRSAAMVAHAASLAAGLRRIGGIPDMLAEEYWPVMPEGCEIPDRAPAFVSARHEGDEKVTDAFWQWDGIVASLDPDDDPFIVRLNQALSYAHTLPEWIIQAMPGVKEGCPIATFPTRSEAFLALAEALVPKEDA